jgi:hypothetical protein
LQHGDITYTSTACKKQGCGTSKDCLRHGDNKTWNPEDPGQPCKLDMGEGGRIVGGLDTKDIMSNSASNCADDETTSNLFNSIDGELDAPYKTYTCIACKKQARGTSEDCLRNGDNKTRVLEEPGHAFNGDIDEGKEIGGILDTKDITSNLASNLFDSIKGAPYKTYTGTTCKKRARGMSEDCLRHGDNRTRVLDEPGHACKADMDEGGGNEGGLDTKDIMSSSITHGADDETTSNFFNSINGDILQCHILSLLDARSLASCSAVCTRWRDLATADNLWERFVQEILSKQPLLPLCIMHRDDDASTISRFLVYSIAMVDSQQRELTLGEICGRTWEIRLKPTCGPYWLGFDPTQAGNPGLNRYFHCDGYLTSGPDDPIWGGQESVWKFVRVRGAETIEGGEQGVQINNWPPHRVLRLKDGLWAMDNMYSVYITVRDNPAFSSASRTRDKQIIKAPCTSCSPPTYRLLPATHKSASRISLTSDKGLSR